MRQLSKKPAGQPLERPEIDYPCAWSYRVIGEDCSQVEEAIIAACSPLRVKISYSHSSSSGKYHSLNAELEVPTEEVRLQIYENLKSSPAIKVIL